MKNSEVPVLIVEDDASIALLLQYNLEKKGYKVDVVYSFADALSRINSKVYSALILDWNLPDGTGIELCKRIRNHSKINAVGILMLTARGEEFDEVAAFGAGVDDYITKPFSIDTLLSRLKAVLRRSFFVKQSFQELLQFENIKLNTQEHRAYRGQRLLMLGPTEYKLLELFLQNPKKVFTREELLNNIWGKNLNVEIRTIDVHIVRLRRELNAEGERDVIRTVRSAGYALDVL